MNNSTVTMRDMLEAGAHYGHQCRRWNPKMKRYIFGSRNGIHILDLQKTFRCLKSSLEFVENAVAHGGHVLFVGTKRQARDIVKEEGSRCQMFFVNSRWLGGTLTNYQTIRQSIHRLKKIERMLEESVRGKLTKKELLNLDRIREKLDMNLGGIKDMHGLPKVLFVTDSHKEYLAVNEAKKLGIPIVAITDSNSDPELIDYPIPANDDSLKSLQLFTKAVADACLSGLSRRKEFATEESQGQGSKEGTIYDQTGHSVKVTKKK